MCDFFYDIYFKIFKPLKVLLAVNCFIGIYTLLIVCMNSYAVVQNHKSERGQANTIIEKKSNCGAYQKTFSEETQHPIYYADDLLIENPEGLSENNRSPVPVEYFIPNTKEYSNKHVNKAALDLSSQDPIEKDEKYRKVNVQQAFEKLRQYHAWLDYYDSVITTSNKERAGSINSDDEKFVKRCLRVLSNNSIYMIKSCGLLVVSTCTTFNLFGLAVSSGAEMLAPCIGGIIGMSPVFASSFYDTCAEAREASRQCKMPCCNRQDALTDDLSEESTKTSHSHNDKTHKQRHNKRFCCGRGIKYSVILVVSVASGWLDAKNSQLGMIKLLNEKVGFESDLGLTLGLGIRGLNWIFSTTLYIVGLNRLWSTFKTVGKGIYTGEVSKEEQRKQENAVRVFQAFCKTQTNEEVEVTDIAFKDAVSCMFDNRLSGTHAREFLFQCQYIEGEKEYAKPSSAVNRLRYGVWALTAVGSVIVMVVVFPNAFVVPGYINIITSANITAESIISANCSDVLHQSQGWTVVLQNEYWDVLLGMGSYFFQAISLSPNLVALLRDGLTVCHIVCLGLKLCAYCDADKESAAIVPHTFCASDWRDKISFCGTMLGIVGYCYLISQSITPAVAIAHVIQCGVGNIAYIGSWAVGISPGIAMLPIIGVLLVSRHVYRDILRKLFPVSKPAFSPKLNTVPEYSTRHPNVIFDETPLSDDQEDDDMRSLEEADEYLTEAIKGEIDFTGYPFDYPLSCSELEGNKKKITIKEVLAQLKESAL